MTERDLEEAWLSFVTALAERPLGDDDEMPEFGPGATSDQLRAYEVSLGYSLPSELARLYAIHDGERSHTLYKYRQFLSLERAAQAYAQLLELQEECTEYEGEARGPVKTTPYINPKWIPIAQAATGRSYVGIDLDPDEGGQRGQVIAFYTDDDVREVLAPSLTVWLNDRATQIRNAPPLPKKSAKPKAAKATKQKRIATAAEKVDAAAKQNGPKKPKKA